MHVVQRSLVIPQVSKYRYSGENRTPGFVEVRLYLTLPWQNIIVSVFDPASCRLYYYNVCDIGTKRRCVVKLNSIPTAPFFLCVLPTVVMNDDACKSRVHKHSGQTALDRAKRSTF